MQPACQWIRSARDFAQHYVFIVILGLAGNGRNGFGVKAACRPTERQLVLSIRYSGLEARPWLATVCHLSLTVTVRTGLAAARNELATQASGCAPGRAIRKNNKLIRKLFFFWHGTGFGLLQSREGRPSWHF
jgi:hypothetical protein